MSRNPRPHKAKEKAAAILLTALLQACISAETKQSPRPYGITASKEGRVFISDFDQGVVVLNKQLRELYRIEDLNTPHAVAQLQNGNLLIADFTGDGVYEYSSAGDRLGLFYGYKGMRPVDIYLSQKEEAWICDYASNKVIKISDIHGQRHDYTLVSPIGFQGPHSVVEDQQGNVYVVETHAGRIQKFSPQLAFMGFIGGGAPHKEADGWKKNYTPDALTKSELLNRPMSIAISGGKHLLAVEAGSSRIQRFDLKSGKRKGTLIRDLNRPYDIDTQEGTLFIADTYNKRIIRTSRNKWSADP